MLQRNIFSLFLLLLFITAQAQTNTVYTIKAFLPFWNGSTITLKINDLLINEGSIENDIYSYTSTTSKSEPAVLEIRKGKTTVYTPFFIEPGTIKLRDKGNKTIVAYGTKNNNDYVAINSVIDSLATTLHTTDIAAIKKYKRQVASGFIKEHLNSIVSLQLLYDYYYLDNAISDSTYFLLYHALHNDLKNTFLGHKLNGEATVSMATATGVAAPNLLLPDTTGKSSSLFEQEKYTLIDFWASWCRPCRRQNPELVKIFNKYKNENFTITSISLDANVGPWKEAIKKDRLAWHHLIDTKSWNGLAAKQFGVRAIPTNFLIGPYGTIIAQNLSPSMLDIKLHELLELKTNTSD